MWTAADEGAPTRLVETTVEINDARKLRRPDKIVQALGGDVAGKTVALLGLTFKTGADDMCDSPSLAIAPALPFRALDLARLKAALRAPVLVDLSNVYQPGDVRAQGFRYESVGRPGGSADGARRPSAQPDLLTKPKLRRRQVALAFPEKSAIARTRTGRVRAIWQSYGWLPMLALGLGLVLVACVYGALSGSDSWHRYRASPSIPAANVVWKRGWGQPPLRTGVIVQRSRPFSPSCSPLIDRQQSARFATTLDLGGPLPQKEHHARRRS